jgi:Sec-independent protein secretion pathway component TatC
MALVLFVAVALYTVVEAQFISAYLGRNPLLFLFGAYWGSFVCLPFRRKNEVNT